MSINEYDDDDDNEHDDEWVPIMTKQLPAPNAVLHLVKCACVKSACSANQCNCQKVGLNCDDEDNIDENDIDYIQYDDDDGRLSSD